MRISSRGIPFERMVQRTKATRLHHREDLRNERAKVRCIQDRTQENKLRVLRSKVRPL